MTEEKKYTTIEKEDVDEVGYIIYRNDGQGYVSNSPTSLYSLEDAKNVLAEFVRKGMPINEVRVVEATLSHHREVKIVGDQGVPTPKQPSLILAP